MVLWQKVKFDCQEGVCQPDSDSKDTYGDIAVAFPNLSNLAMILAVLQSQQLLLSAVSVA